jgi:outer membrane protein OmpA-like peptidoglycan-associated protein
MIARWFWAVLVALVVIAIGVIFWQTGNRTTVVPHLAQSPPVAPAAPTVAQAPSTNAAAQTGEKEAAAPTSPGGPSAPTVTQVPASYAAAPTAEKQSGPAAPTVTRVPASNAAVPTAEKQPGPAAPTVTQIPAPDAAAPTAEKEPQSAAPQTAATNAAPTGGENQPVTKTNDPASDANAKATAELASRKPGFSPKALLGSLNDSVINFGADSADLPAPTVSFLQNAANDLKQMPAGYRLEIAGYTDNTGRAAMNVALSQRRADAVREALVKSGTNPDMLVAKGYGSADPIASNDTPDGRLRNRRIEYRFLKTPDRH